MDSTRFDDLTVDFLVRRRSFLGFALAASAGLMGRTVAAQTSGPVAPAADRGTCENLRPWSPCLRGGCCANGCGPIGHHRGRCSCAKRARGDSKCVSDESFFDPGRGCKTDEDCPPNAFCIDHRGCVGGRQFRCVRKCQP